MSSIKYSVLFIMTYLAILAVPLSADEKKQGGPPPALVVVDEVKSGMIAPRADFVGTVYYEEVSDIASEVSGRVETVLFEEGQRVRKGNVLIKLSSDLLEKTILSTKASHEQVLSELERARLDFRRIDNLYKQESIAEQLYDENKYRVIGLEKKAASLKADVERLEIEREKKSVVAPYSGVVLHKNVDRGEWLREGSVIATIAKDDVLDIVAEVPEEVIVLLKTGMRVTVRAGGKEVKGKIFALVPRGDVATRTFPVKIRAKNTMSLLEGMEARVSLPVGTEQRGLIVPRDAVIKVFGNDVVFAVIEGKAQMIPVAVAGYEGLVSGIVSQDLQEGMKVVIKGHERLRNEQSVTVIEGVQK